MRQVHSIVASNGYGRMPNLIESVVVASADSQAWRHATDGRQGPVVDPNQLTSLNAMISYVAHASGVAEFRVERNLSNRFNIPNAKCMAAVDFDPALRYLAAYL